MVYVLVERGDVALYDVLGARAADREELEDTLLRAALTRLLLVEFARVHDRRFDEVQVRVRATVQRWVVSQDEVNKRSVDDSLREAPDWHGTNAVLRLPSCDHDLLRRAQPIPHLALQPHPEVRAVGANALKQRSSRHQVLLGSGLGLGSLLQSKSLAELVRQGLHADEASARGGVPAQTLARTWSRPTRSLREPSSGGYMRMPHSSRAPKSWMMTELRRLARSSATSGRSASRTITDTICVADKPVTRAVAVDLSGAFFDRGAFPGTQVTVEQRRIG